MHRWCDMARFHQRGKVRWNTPQGQTHGHVVEVRTDDFQFANQRFTASKDDPAYIVESDKSGARAAHKESALSPA